MADKKKKKKTNEEENPVVNETAEQTDETKVVDEPVEVEVTDDKSDALKKELDEQKDIYLRLVAEFDNYKKRTSKESLRIGSDARASVIKELLPAVDNFLTTLDHADASHEDFKKGVELSVKNFLNILKKQGLEEIESEGKEFDPNFHYAISQIESEDLGENIIAQVMQKGYKIGDNVIRPAMVSVANCK